MGRCIGIGKKLRENRYYILILAEILCILLTLPGCFREERLIYRFSGEEIPQEAPQYKGEYVSLRPGVYQLRAESLMESGQSAYFEIKSDDGYFNSLKGNGVSLVSGEGYTEFEVYVSQTVPRAYVQCDFHEGDGSMLADVSLYRLNWGSRIAVFCEISVFILIDMLVLFRKRILEGRMTGERQVVFWVLAAGVLAVYFPYLTDYFYLGADTHYHLLRIEGLADTLRQGGTFPVRVHGYTNYGHGSLIPLFYSDFFLYIPALLRLVGFPLMTAYKMFIFVIIAANGVIAYLSFQRCAGDSRAALFGSIVHLFSPFFMLNLYQRGAVGEGAAMAFMPLVCCGMFLLLTEEESVSYRRHKWWVVAGISAILHCHLLSVETAALFMGIVCAVFWKKTFRKHTFVQLAESVIIVLAVNCWYWLPMLRMMAVDSYHLWDSYNMGISERGLLLSDALELLPERQSEPTLLGAGMLAAVLAYPFLILSQNGTLSQKGTLSRCGSAKETDSARGRGMEYGCMTAWALTVLALWMSTRYFPWDMLGKIPLIRSFVMSLQFPARFMIPGSAACALFAVFFYLRLRRMESGRYRIIISVLAVAVAGGAVYYGNSIAFDSSAVRLYTAENIGTANVWNINFMPLECDLSEFYYHQPTAGRGVEYGDYVKRGTTVTMYLENKTQEPSYLEIPLTGYKGYGISASAGDGGMPYITEDRGAHGDIRIAVPGNYSGRITVSYRGGVLFGAAEGISLLSVGGLLYMEIRGRKRRRC